jgi:hypothetical protein
MENAMPPWNALRKDTDLKAGMHVKCVSIAQWHSHLYCYVVNETVNDIISLTDKSFLIMYTRWFKHQRPIENTVIVSLPDTALSTHIER